jgi:CTP synthase
VAKPTKFVFVTGGVLSGLGKGITAASIGNLLKARGLKVNIQKLDPYLNMDAGMLNPAEHGECFVTKDGAETDLDLGHYERFIDEELTQSSSVMSGRILHKVFENERNGKYLGKTVQFIPHVTNAIQEEVLKAAKGFDVQIVEIGGTVGDYEGLSFVEAIRELSLKVGRENSAFIHVVYMPYLGASHEFKTKPAQNAVRDLRGLGIVPDALMVRSETKAPVGVLNKLSLFSGVPPEAIALLPNAKTIYQVPLTLEDTGIADVLCARLGIGTKKPALTEWRQMVDRALSKPAKKVTVGMVAKYMDNHDTYISVTEALDAAAWQEGVDLTVRWIDAEDLDKPETDITEALEGCDGIVVPGGFGQRALEGKIKAAQLALKNKLPYLGLCLGLQMAVIAAARNGGIKDATSQELNPEGKNLLISTMADQKGLENTGGTMRLGDYTCVIEKSSLAQKVYASTKIVERHRHRYECNNAYRDQYETWGIKASGTSPDGTLVEMIEGIDHPYFIATQAHPEFKSRPHRPHPLFAGFIQAIK